MKRLILAAGVAALAISAPAASQPGGKGGGNDRPKAAKVQKERGGGKAVQKRGNPRQAAQQRGNQRQAAQQRSNAREKRAQQARKTQEKRVQQRRNAQSNRAESRQRVAEQRSKQRQRAAQQARRGDDRQIRAQQRRVAEQRSNARDRAFERRDRVAERQVENRNRQFQRLADGRRIAARDRDWDDWRELARRGHWVDGCPPGLAKKRVACVPPGQAKKMVGQRLNVVRQNVAFRDLPDRLRYVYRDTPDHYYRYGDGYMYRVNRSNDVVSALLPLFGLGLTSGQQFPTAYSNHYMPSAYQPFYPAASQYDYRYANGYIYEVDPYTGLIRDVDPMLGYGYGYGQMLPATYSAYNVPYQYRPAYQDTSDHYYRYAPGAIYQVDPQTSLITGVAALLGNGMTVGQPIPAGYGTYNVPYGYRGQYYDTPDAWYRYSAGNIYRVDPTTQLVTAIVASILT